jgi:hypothetical protein
LTVAVQEVLASETVVWLHSWIIITLWRDCTLKAIPKTPSLPSLNNHLVPAILKEGID